MRWEMQRERRYRKLHLTDHFHRSQIWRRDAYPEALLRRAFLGDTGAFWEAFPR